MSTQDLRDKYDSRAKPRQLVGQAIREECPGGAEALEALELIHHITNRHGWREDDGTATPLALCYNHLCRIVNAMDRAIRLRYDMPVGDERCQLVDELADNV